MTDESRDLDLIEVSPDQDLTTFRSKLSAIHNFDVGPLEAWKLTAFAAGPGCRPGKEILGQTFPLRYWFLHQVGIQQEDGEIVQVIRTVLFDPSGNAYSFSSEGVYASLKLLIQSMGDGPYDPPLSIVVREKSVRSGRAFYWIEPAPERLVKREMETSA
jgi:hypothetical protein